MSSALFADQKVYAEGTNHPASYPIIFTWVLNAHLSPYSRGSLHSDSHSKAIEACEEP